MSHKTRNGDPEDAKTSARNGPPPSDPPPESVEEALGQALRHGRNALAEGLLAGRALLDAASLAVSGRPASASPGRAPETEAARALSGLAGTLGSLAERLRADSPDASRHLIEALLEALDSEIGRWESNARNDPDARAVLRAFLGLRELLWELGMRPAPRDESEPKPAPKPQRRARKRPAAKKTADANGDAKQPGTTRRRRVQRIEVER